MFAITAIEPIPCDDATVVNSRGDCVGAPRKIDRGKTPRREEEPMAARASYNLSGIIYSICNRLDRAWEVNLRKATSRQYEAVQAIAVLRRWTKIRLVITDNLSRSIYSGAEGVQLSARAWKYDIRELGAGEGMVLAIQGACVGPDDAPGVTYTRHVRSAAIGVGRINERELTLS